MSTVAGAPGITVNRIPDPAEPVPAIAWPTLLLLVGGLALWGTSSALALSDVWPLWVSILPNAVASYLLFTVAHDAGHHAASSNKRLNDWMGRLATPLFAPHASFPTWRYIHMQHHMNTNKDDGTDPDHFTMRGPGWQRLLRWATIDYWYLVFYLPKLRKRPRQEKIEEAIALLLFAGVIAGSIVAGLGVQFLLLLYVPCRLAIVYLAWAFDYLPHNGLHHTPRQDRLKTTRNRVGFERVLSPILLYQNYHLVHHLHPLVPFYRYIAVWRRNEESYLEGEPALSTIRGRPITSDEYRSLRELAEH